jgi:putative transposase
MRTFEFAAGVPFFLRNVPYKFIAPKSVEGREYWIIANRTDPEPIQERISVYELDTLYDKGELRGDFSDQGEQTETPRTVRLRRRREVPLSDLDPNTKQRIRFRLAVIQAVEEQTSPGVRNVPIRSNGELVYEGAKKVPETVLSRKLQELGRTLGREILGKETTICVSAYYEWRRLLHDSLHQNDLGGNLEGRGNRRQLAPEARNIIRDVIATLLDAAKHKKRVGQRPIVTMEEIRATAKAKIEALQVAHPEIENLRVPSRPTIYKIFNSFPKFLRDIGTYGYIETRQRYRYPNPEQMPDACLSVVQFDETRLPIFVVHEALGIPIGRPWLAWLVDERSDCIIGFYLGFSPPSDMVFASVFRHACSRKSYIQTEYPSIARPYTYSGVPRMVIFDNSLHAHSNSIGEISGNAQFNYRFTPARMPWVKGQVEGAFRVANETWLKHMSGFVLNIGQSFDKSEYDPAKNSVMGFRHLLLIFHHWLFDYYHMRKPENAIMSPHDRWQEGTRIIKPEFLERGADLDRVFGIVRRGRLDHRGVRYERLWYYSDEIHEPRKAYGDVLDVEVKHNPLNMSKVFVRVPTCRDRSWVEGRALETEYASKVDLHIHQLYQKHAERIFGKSECVADWYSSAYHLHDLIRQSAPDALSIQSRTLFARSIGIDTAHLFADIDHDGNIGHRTLGGQPLDPFMQHTSHAVPDSPVEPAHTLNLPKNPTSDSPPLAKSKREIPVFGSDKSLGSNS